MIIIITYKNVVVVAAAKSIKECILILFFWGGGAKTVSIDSSIQCDKIWQKFGKISLATMVWEFI